MFDTFEEPAPEEARAYSYEIMTCVQGRWTVESVMDSVVEARSRARLMLERRSCQEVKVLRYRGPRGEAGVSSEILHEVRGGRPPAPAPATAPRRRLVAANGETESCQNLGALSTWENRRYLATLLRDYLTHHALLPSELLFDWRHAKRLLNEGSLVPDAVQRVARVQAQRAKEAPKARAEALDRLVGQAAARARDLRPAALALLGGRRLAAGALPALTGTTAAGGGRGGDRGGDRGGASLAAACLGEHLTGLSDHGSKLVRLMALLPAAGTPWVGCIEAMMAECLLFPEPMRGLFPARPGAGPLISRLLDLAMGRSSIGRPDGEDGEDLPQVAALAYLIDRGEAPHCAAALEGWIAPLLSAREPLDPAQPDQEGRFLEQLGPRLRRGSGEWIGGEAARRALEQRRRLTRQNALRGPGPGRR